MKNEILFYTVVFLSNIIQAITGFAGTMLAMPASMMLIGVEQAKVILNAMGFLSCLWIAIRNFSQINRKEFVKITGFMFVGMFVGMEIFKIAPLAFLLTGYAVFIILIALKKLFIKKEFQIPSQMMIVVLFAAGIIHGMFISGGSLLVIYAVIALKDKAEFRATLSAVWVLLNGSLMVTQIQGGVFTADVIRMTVFCVVPLAIAIFVGNKIYHRINQKAFLNMTYILLLLSGILLIV